MTATIFKNIVEISTPFYRDVYTLLTRIRDGHSKDLVKKIRTEKDPNQQRLLKRSLPCICWSGKFTRREDKCLQEHSGIICLDFDKYENQKQMLSDKELLSKDKYVFSVFISPSGNGLKVLVKVPKSPENHVAYFNALQKHFNNPRFDPTSKNISRVCYESYDPQLFLNHNSSVWEDIVEEEVKEVTKYQDEPTIPLRGEDRIVDRLMKWWLRKYPMSEGQRNQNTYILAIKFNEFGVSREKCEDILMNYANESFTREEIIRTIRSAYDNRVLWNTKYFEDTERVNDIKEKIRRGVPRKQITNELTDVVDVKEIDGMLHRLEEDANIFTFWYKTDKGFPQIIHIEFKSFLEMNGFYKYHVEGGKNFVFVRIINNLIDHTSEMEIKDFVLDYLLKLEDKTVYNYFADKTRFFKEEFLSMLSTIDVFFISDTKDTSYLYYRNCAVKITKDEVVPIDYIDLGGYVWKEQVIDRTFKICPVSPSSDFKKFICNINANQDDRISTMESTLGFLMHGYKDPSFCPAVILNDEIISDNPEGGTGKGLLMSSLSQMKKMVVIDGKAFNFEKSFPYQLVSADTQILCFDDVKKYFDFERLFSVITEGLDLEKKNKDAIKIPFKKSPKVTITTNYAIKGSGNSFARRKWELELHQYYNERFTPTMEFGRRFYDEWNDDDWCDFDNYMIGCLMGYLNTGLVRSKFVNLKIRQLSAETCHEFIEWCGLIGDRNMEEVYIEPNKRMYLNDLYTKFVEEYPDYAPKSKLTISRNKFYKWVYAYGFYRAGVFPEEGRDMQGKWVIIKIKDDKVNQPVEVDDIVPF